MKPVPVPPVAIAEKQLKDYADGKLCDGLSIQVTAAWIKARIDGGTLDGAFGKALSDIGWGEYGKGCLTNREKAEAVYESLRVVLANKRLMSGLEYDRLALFMQRWRCHLEMH